jgi:putative phage-type endonuclease
MVDFESRLHYEWLRKRQSGIGGSDIAAIMGLSKYRTAMHVYLDKTRQIAPDKQETEEQWRGQRLEGAILDMYEHRVPDVILERNEEMTINRHPGVPHFLGSYDATAVPADVAIQPRYGARYVVDAKSADLAVAHEWGRDGSCTAPIEYVTQILWYMGIGDFSKGDLAALIGGRNFRIITIERENDLIEIFQREADRFWNEHVMKLVPPSIDTVHRTAESVVKSVFGSKPARFAELEPTKYLEQLLREYYTGQAMESVGKRLRKRAKAALIELQGGLGSTKITGTEFELASSVVEKKAYEVKATSYVDFKVKAPRGTITPMFEEAERLLETLVENDVDRRLLAAALEDEEGED